MTNYEKYGFCPYSKHLTDKDCNIMGLCIDCDTYFDGYNKGMADAIDECADKFAEILSNMTQICGTNCPVKCNWGTEETCKDMCKKWFIEQLKEKNK